MKKYIISALLTFITVFISIWCFRIAILPGGGPVSMYVPIIKLFPLYSVSGAKIFCGFLEYCKYYPHVWWIEYLGSLFVWVGIFLLFVKTDRWRMKLFMLIVSVILLIFVLWSVNHIYTTYFYIDLNHISIQ